jgi:hypothetical protein
MPREGIVTITVLNVGEGDSLLVSFPSSVGTKWGMIDCFWPSSLDEPPVLQLLRFAAQQKRTTSAR